MNEVLSIIKRRRSVREFKPEQIKDEELEMILDAAAFAPSGHNNQPWHFTVIQKREIIDHINQRSKENMARSEVEWIKKLGSKPGYDVTYGAPTLIIVSGDPSAISWRADCAAAIQNILLAAESLDIGSVWLGLVKFCFQDENEVEKLGLPDGYEMYYGVSLGYKAKDAAGEAPARRENIVNHLNKW